MPRENGDADDLAAIIEDNRNRLAEKLVKAHAAGAHWIVECRDMWAARDGGAGVYVVVCNTSRQVDHIASRCRGGQSDTRLLGVFETSRPLDEQWPGLTLEQWQARRSGAGYPFHRNIRELFKR